MRAARRRQESIAPEESGDLSPAQRWLESLDLRGLAPRGLDRRASLSITSTPTRAGFGACARAGCTCRHYEDREGRCECSHPVEDHW